MPDTGKHPQISLTPTGISGEPKTTPPALTGEEWLRAMQDEGKIQAQGQYRIAKWRELFAQCPFPPTDQFDAAVMVGVLDDRLRVQEMIANRSGSPEASAYGFHADLFERHLGFTLETGDAFVAAGLPLRRALKGEPIDRELLKKFDQFLFGLLRTEEHRKSFPSVLEDRVRLAVKRNDVPFFTELGKELSKPANFRSAIQLKDFQLPPAKNFLADNWSQLKDCPDKIGLCDFTWDALGNFFVFKFNGYKGSIRDLARDASLVKRDKPTVKNVCLFKGAIWQVGKDEKKICLLATGVMPLTKG